MTRLVASFSLPGLMLGLLFLCGSLTPSLLPRIPAVQGVLSGTAFASGYGLGVGLLWVWHVMGFGDVRGKAQQALFWTLLLPLFALTAFTFYRNTVWQNSIRERMALADVEGSYPWLIAAVAILVALVLILLGRSLVLLAAVTSTRLERLLPRRAAKALFDAIYGHWIRLPDEDRPELYLFGLSLGALGSEAPADLVTLFSQPISGALWSGPRTMWAQVTARRNEGTPYRLPAFRDGALVRFMNQDGIAAPDGAAWGPMRLLYLQYGSDLMIFFSPDLLLKSPDWLGEGTARARDVSPFFTWYPIVIFLQGAFDIPMATSTPEGYGHTYRAEHDIDGWLEVTEPQGWTAADTARLKELFDDFTASPL